MATAVQPAMSMAPFNTLSNQCVDPNEFFDFGQLPSPTQPATLKRESSAPSAMASPTSTNIDDDLQTPAKPSHEYELFKQQTGLPSGSIAGLAPSYNTGFPMFSSSGIDEMAMMGGDSLMDASSWNTGLPMDVSMNMGIDYRQNSFVFNEASQDDFVDPSAITQEEVPNVRVWPGMHQQQAAMAKAQAQAQQQRAQQMAHQKQQQAMQQQQQQQQQQTRLPSTSQASRKTSSPLSDAHTEEMITRVVAQIRADSQNASTTMQENNQGLLPHIIRAKKDEEDMDEDERLLASEEGKKLSSKERRQLRNKVSARAFRSRRKEYIGQLEGEVAMKVNEANELRAQNRLLMEENARSRAFIERLLRHQAFTPFLEELSRDESLQIKAPMTTMASSSATVTAAPAPAFQAPQPFNGMSQPETTQVSMPMAPEPQIDFAMLNLNNSNNANNANWNVNNGFNFQQPVAFAVTELPEGPSNPLDTQAMSGKGYSAIFDAEDDAADEIKADYPTVKCPVPSTESATAPVDEAEDENDEYALYYSTPARTTAAPASAPLEEQEALFTNPEKAFAHYSLVLSDEANETRLAERLQRKIAAMSPAMQRIADITSMLDS